MPGPAEFEQLPAHADWRDVVAAAELPTAGPDLMVALDIDGTVLRHDTSLSPRVYEAVRAHIDAGTHIMLSTGRGISATQIVLEQLGMDRGYAIASNGSIVLSLGDTHPESMTTPLSPDVATDAVPVRLIYSHSFDPSAELKILSEHLEGAIFLVESVTQKRRLTALFPEGELTGPSVIVPLEELSIPDATRLTVRMPDITPHELLATIESLGLSGVEYAVGWSAWLDIAPAGISKATGLEDVRRELGISPRATVTCGDSGNDTEMLDWAHLGVAMGNSPAYIRKHANTVTEHVNDDGAALLLEELLG